MTLSIPADVRRRVKERARDYCEYCRSSLRFAIQSFSIEHIIPRSRGGRDTEGNLALSCQGCNNHKYNRIECLDAVTGKRVSLFNPRSQKWRDHFSWNEDFSLVIGVTPTGRATVEALRLNRSGLVNLRRLLYEAGEHPPEEA